MKEKFVCKILSWFSYHNYLHNRQDAIHKVITHKIAPRLVNNKRYEAENQTKDDQFMKKGNNILEKIS